MLGAFFFSLFSSLPFSSLSAEKKNYKKKSEADEPATLLAHPPLKPPGLQHFVFIVVLTVHTVCFVCVRRR